MIDTFALKKRIYDMAISGRLTLHLANDTPVDSSLLSYQEEGVDSLPEIPETWKYCYFDDVLINRDSERIPVSVADRKKLSKKFDYYGASGVIDKVDNYLFDESLLLIGEDGANLLSRSTPIAFIAKGKYWVNNHAHVLQATEHVLLEYVEIYINAISLVPYVTGSAQPKLSQHMMSKIPVPVPPIEEQQRIVETVRSVFDHLVLIDTLQNQYQDNLATLKSKIIDAGIQGKLTEQLPEDGTAEELYQQIQQEKLALEKAGKIKKSKPLPPISDEEKPFDIPDNWKWVRLDSIASVISKGTTPRGGKVSYCENGIGFLRAENLKGFDKLNLCNLNYIDENVHIGFLKRSILEDGDILISIAGTLGRTGLVRKADLPLNANQAIAFIRPVNKDRLDLSYVIYSLNAKAIQKMMDYKKVEMAIPNLSLAVISNTIIPLPPLAEQKRIVAKLEELLPLCDNTL